MRMGASSGLAGGDQEAPMSKAATIKKQAAPCVECQRCRQPMSLVRTAIIGIWRKRLFFLCMSCGSVRTVEPEPK